MGERAKEGEGGGESSNPSKTLPEPYQFERKQSHEPTITNNHNEQWKRGGGEGAEMPTGDFYFDELSRFSGGARKYALRAKENKLPL